MGFHAKTSDRAERRATRQAFLTVQSLQNRAKSKFLLRPSSHNFNENALSAGEVHIHLIVLIRVDGGEGTRLDLGLESRTLARGHGDVAVVEDREDSSMLVGGWVVGATGHAGSAENNVDFGVLSGQLVAENDAVDLGGKWCAG